MTLINLTESYLDSGRASLFEKMRMGFALDLYYASSLSALSEFRKSPPKGTDRSYENLSAHVIIDNLELRLIDEKESTSLTDAFLKFFNPCLNFPAFKIRDSSGYHGAIWDAGNASEFKKARENLGLNTKTFSLPSKVYLQYLHDDNAGLLVIKGFASEMTGAKQKSFLRKLAGFSPFFVQLPQPDY